MMRVSPDYLHLPSGRKPPSLKSSCKDDNPAVIGRIPGYTTLESKPLKVRSTSSSTMLPTTTTMASTEVLLPHRSSLPFNGDAQAPASLAAPAIQASKLREDGDDANGASANAGDILLRWGHNKRSRRSRTAAGDELSSSFHSRQASKTPRRRSRSLAVAPAPARPISCVSYTRGATLRSCAPLIRESSILARGATGHPQARSDQRSPLDPPADKRVAIAAAEPRQPPDRDGGGTAVAASEKLGPEEVLELPRIYITLSRKEKEEDFMAMKGTKLSQRPKKRAKNIDKALQNCYPGMWLPDITRGRYEVREKKKCVKKKRRGLKGMENVDSDSG